MAYNCVMTPDFVSPIDTEINRKMFARICHCNHFTPAAEAEMESTSLLPWRNEPVTVAEEEVEAKPDKSAFEYDKANH